MCWNLHVLFWHACNGSHVLYWHVLCQPHGIDFMCYINMYIEASMLNWHLWYHKHVPFQLKYNVVVIMIKQCMWYATVNNNSYRIYTCTIIIITEHRLNATVYMLCTILYRVHYRSTLAKKTLYLVGLALAGPDVSGLPITMSCKKYRVALHIHGYCTLYT